VVSTMTASSTAAGSRSGPHAVRYTPVHTIYAHTGAVHVTRYNATGRYLLTGGADQQIRLWNAKTGAPEGRDSRGRSPCIQHYSAHSYEVLCLDVAPDSTRFASGGPDRSVLTWDVASGQVLRRFNAHTGRVNDVRFSGAREDGSVLYAAGSDTSVRAYDLRAAGAWRPIWEAQDAHDAILALALTPGRVHTASVDGALRTYDMRMGELRTDVLGEPITSLSPTHDGTAILASTLDATHRLIDMADGTQLQKYMGHMNQSFRCHSSLASDEAVVLAGDENGTLFAWDTLTGRCRFHVRPALEDRRGRSVCMFWTESSPDEAAHEVATATSSGVLLVWRGT